MARKSPHTLPFLLRRRESGGYVYHRRVPADVRSAVSGEVVCPWSGEVRLVGSGGTIKIAFATTDLATAKQRWSEVHAQIEVIVGSAIRRERRDRRLSARRDVTRVAGLTDKQIETLAARLEHRILAEQAEKLLDPQTFAALPEEGPDAPAMTRRERINSMYWDHHREAEFAKVLRSDFDFAELNRPLVMSTTRGLLDEGEEVQPGERAFIVPDAVTGILQDNGVDLPPGHKDRPRIADALLAAMQRGHEAAMRRMEGDASVKTPPDPGPVMIASTAATGARVPLSAAFKDWQKSQRPRPNTLLDYGCQVRRFISVHGDLAVGDITREHIKSFRDLMLDFPKGVPRALQDAPVAEIIAWAKKEGAPTIAITTINDKCIGAISAILALLVEQGILPINVCNKTKFKLKDGDAKARRPYDDDDIGRLLAAPLYAAKPKVPKAACGAAGPWLPLLAMFTGGRLEELGQLRVDDVKEIDGIPYFDLETLDDTGGRIKRKTKSSRRNVPLHPMLVELGFLNYVNAMRERRNERLFPALVLSHDRYTANFSKWWSRYPRKHVSKDKAKCFHSFRHRFADALRETESSDAIREKLMGHSSDSTFAKYGLGEQIKRLEVVIGQVRVPDCIKNDVDRLRLSLKCAS